ncbi:hypothetical protein BDN72DRAFT_853762 [Pluteus cervinus]|uniref:Uncharacterized protein n=1 Tax=Pluteus cervinus TaxID=181527 RepID=A0ACD3BAQ9_9AGAR|nr:hypothetical protein BDN72DRAFT_853762 [Pluteus cervinus]
MSSPSYPSFNEPAHGVARVGLNYQWGDPAVIEKNLELLGAIQTIKMTEDGTNTHEKDVYVSNVRSLGSYNIMDAKKLTIVVPGHPRIWSDRPMPYQVPPDVRPRAYKEVKCKLWHHAMSPLFLAVDRSAQDQGRDPLDWASVDFVTDRNNLRSLLCWILGRDHPKTSRFDLQLAGNKTVIMVASGWRPRTHKFQPGMVTSSYGFSFEKESTRSYPGLEKSVQHNRVVQYNMSGLNMVVRFEVDGCVLPAESNSGSPDSGEGPLALPTESGLSEALSPIHFSMSSTPPSVTVLSGGACVPESCILEVTTVKNVKWLETYAQLFFSQTPHHFSARQAEGTVKQVKKAHITSPTLQKVEKKLQPGLKKLRRFLVQLQELVILHGKDQRLSLIYENKELTLFRMRNDVCCIPEEYLARFSSKA